MLDAFLKVAYEQSERQHAQQELVDLMKQLPTEELHQVVRTGNIKLAYECGPSMLVGSQGWLAQFKGTPFMEQAIALEQEELQGDMARQQRDSAESQVRTQGYAQQDQLRMKKRLLELQKAKSELGVLQQAGVPVSGNLPEAPTASADPMAPKEASRLAARFTKAAAALKHAEDDPLEQLRAATDDLKRGGVRPPIKKERLDHYAHQTERFRAAAKNLRHEGSRATAKALGAAVGVGGTLYAAHKYRARQKSEEKQAGVGGALLRLAQQNPVAVAGGALGAYQGLTGQDGGIIEGIKGGVTGAALGHVAGGMGGHLLEGKSVSDAAKAYGHQVKREAGILGGHLGVQREKPLFKHIAPASPQQLSLPSLGG